MLGTGGGYDIVDAGDGGPNGGYCIVEGVEGADDGGCVPTAVSIGAGLCLGPLSLRDRTDAGEGARRRTAAARAAGGGGGGRGAPPFTFIYPPSRCFFGCLSS